jgi:hypothetical protein
MPHSRRCSPPLPPPPTFPTLRPRCRPNSQQKLLVHGTHGGSSPAHLTAQRPRHRHGATSHSAKALLGSYLDALPSLRGRGSPTAKENKHSRLRILPFSGPHPAGHGTTAISQAPCAGKAHWLRRSSGLGTNRATTLGRQYMLSPRTTQNTDGAQHPTLTFSLRSHGSRTTKYNLGHATALWRDHTLLLRTTRTTP